MGIPQKERPKPERPGGLDDRGGRFWQQAVDQYGMTPTEVEILTEVCRTMDSLDSLATMVAEDGPKVTGASGQVAVHPAITASTGLRVTLHRLLCALGLPDSDGQTLGSVQTTHARTAAAARWEGHTSRLSG
jgi:phage terminase small subunit